MNLDTALAASADQRSGLFSFRDAKNSGMTPKTLRRAQLAGECRKVMRGLYSTAPTPTEPADILREFTMGMLLLNGNVAATGISTAVLRGWPIYGADETCARGVWLNGAPGRTSEHVKIRRPLLEPPVTTVEEWKTVETAWALVDLARDLGAISGVMAMDAALRNKETDAATIARVIDAHSECHRIDRARLMASHADGRHESPGESWTGIILTGGGYELEPQFEIRRTDTGGIARADYRIKGTRVLVEFDGMAKYRGDAGEAVLIEEKRREDDLRRQGWVIVRITWADLFHPERILGWIRAALESAAA